MRKDADLYRLWFRRYVSKPRSNKEMLRIPDKGRINCRYKSSRELVPAKMFLYRGHIGKWRRKNEAGSCKYLVLYTKGRVTLYQGFI